MDKDIINLVATDFFSLADQVKSTVAAQSDGDNWFSFCKSLMVYKEHGPEAVYGRGSTIQEAFDDLFEKLLGEHLICYATGNTYLVKRSHNQFLRKKAGR